MPHFLEEGDRSLFEKPTFLKFLPTGWITVRWFYNNFKSCTHWCDCGKVSAQADTIRYITYQLR